ncbi:MAG: hypothetical protein AAGG38_02215 [Planctomycetota bacterium]
MDEQRVRQIARDEVKDEVTSFFNHYMLNIFPKQVDRIFESHNKDETAHGGLLRRFDRTRWALVGLAVGLSFAGGAGLTKLLTVLV